MTSSADLPPALPSMWRLCRLGYRHEPRLMIAAFALAQLSTLPGAFLALWLPALGRGLLQHRAGLVLVAAAGMGLSSAASWLLGVYSMRVQRRFRDKVTIALEAHVASLQASIATLAHQERPEFLDRLSMLRNQVFVLDHMYMSLFSTCSSASPSPSRCWRRCTSRCCSSACWRFRR
jgi:ATP-binding cassette subfamily B protein